MAMEANMIGDPPPRALCGEGLTKFQEGVGLVLSRWTALQLAVQNEWGGRSSRQKADQLATDIVSLMTNSNVPLYIDELEEMLDENMLLSFNTETEDGSLEQVAEQLMLLHDECLHGHYDTISQLQISSRAVQSVSHSQQLPEEDGVVDEGADEEEELTLEMDINSACKQESQMLDTVESSMAGKLTEEEVADGWCVVPSSSRRRRGQHK